MVRIAFIPDFHFRKLTPRCRKDNFKENILNKLDFIAEKNDILFFLGDLVDRPKLSSDPFTEFNILLKKFKEYTEKGKKLYTILGNHDIVGYNDSVHNVAIGGLREAEVLNIVYDSIIIEGIEFNVIPFKLKRKVPPATKQYSVLLGHYFFEHKKDDEWSVYREEIAGKGYTYVILGHDHEPFPSKQIDNTILLRPGSITRLTKHPYNLVRMPEYLYMECEKGVIKNIFVEKIECAKTPQEVFKPEVFEKGIVEKCEVTITEIKDLLEQLKFNVGNERFSIKSVLKELNAPLEVVEYLRLIHEEKGLRF